jgi:hypothetical protein
MDYMEGVPLDSLPPGHAAEGARCARALLQRLMFRELFNFA